MKHVVLLGDSIFDNKAYVGNGPDVINQLRSKLPVVWNASLRAVDGNVTTNISRQLEQLPGDATHLVVSIGGNDAINSADVLQRKATSTAEVIFQLAAIADQFEYDYQTMLRGILNRNLPTAVCTIYYPRMPEPEVQRLSVTALTVFNDCIIRAAVTMGLPLLDLRLICNEDADYANPIEPSVQGGDKISAAIVRLLSEHDFNKRRTEIFV
jgi:hypothetical protein